MAHANGTEAILPAVEAGAESIEHGAYLNRETLEAMVQEKTIWVPTMTAVGNLRKTARFPEQTVTKILQSTMERVTFFAEKGGLLAPGSDSGAFSVPHGEGGLTEYALMECALGEKTQAVLNRGIEALLQRF